MRITPRALVFLLVVGALAACSGGTSRPAASAPAAPAPSAAPSAPANAGPGGSSNGAASGAVIAGREVPRPLDPPQRVRIADAGLAAQGPTYLAVEHGYFRELGLDVEVMSGLATNDMVTLLSSDQLDVGLQAISPAFYNVVARGVGMRLVADHGTLIPG